MSTPEFNSIEIAPKSTSIPPRHRAETKNNLLAKVVVTSLVLSGIPLLAHLQISTDSALASNADTIGLYLSAPLTQGTDVTVSVTRENFNNVSLTNRGGYSDANCSGAYTIASITLRRSPTLITASTDRDVCFVRSFENYGGAITDSAIRTVSPPDSTSAGSNFMAVPYYEASLTSETERSITFDFPQTVSYVGFWWSAGNAGNVVRFYDASDSLLAELDSQRIVDLLGTSNASTQLVTRLDGGSYQRKEYFGNPRGYKTLTPSSPSSIEPNFIFTYVNLYVGGSLNVKKVQFAGPGFEFDNLAASTSQQVANDSMVLVNQIQRSNSQSAPVSEPTASSPTPTPTPTPTPAPKADPCTSVPTSATVTRQSKSFSGFPINSAALNSAMKRQIRTWLNKHPEEVCVSIAGFTMGPRVLPTDPKLAKDRARSVRAYITSIRPEASFTPITSRTQRLVGDDVRRAKVTLRF
jgi:outer membrane protein OmpA-like peptidoglycan-associated protein